MPADITLGPRGLLLPSAVSSDLLLFHWWLLLARKKGGDRTDRKHLAEVDRHIAECEAYIAQQREFIEKAIQKGRSAEVAVETLDA